jgi:hypothetical protein
MPLRPAMNPKPKPFEIFSYPPDNPDDGRDWVYMMKTDASERDFAEHERRALIMRHAPELLHELKAATELLLQLCDHGRDGKPLPMQSAARHVAMDALNVIDLAEGRKTEGTRYYPPSEG